MGIVTTLLKALLISSGILILALVLMCGMRYGYDNHDWFKDAVDSVGTYLFTNPFM